MADIRETLIKLLYQAPCESELEEKPGRANTEEMENAVKSIGWTIVLCHILPIT